MGRYRKRQKTRTVEVNYSIENVSKDFFVGHVARSHSMAFLWLWRQASICPF